MIKKIILIFYFILFTNKSIAENNIMILKLADGDVEIELFEDVAPNHVKRIKKLSSEKGSFFDSIVDRLLDCTITFGICYGLYYQEKNPLIWMYGLIFLIGTFMTFVVSFLGVSEINSKGLTKFMKTMSSNVNSFNLYFDRDDVQREYEEVNIIATNNFYYGQFFFDSIFMDILKEKTNSINADAIIYEKDRKDFPFYNDEYLYFIAIRYKDQEDSFNFPHE